MATYRKRFRGLKAHQGAGLEPCSSGRPGKLGRGKGTRQACGIPGLTVTCSERPETWEQPRGRAERECAWTCSFAGGLLLLAQCPLQYRHPFSHRPPHHRQTYYPSRLFLTQEGNPAPAASPRVSFRLGWKVLGFPPHSALQVSPRGFSSPKRCWTR